MRKIFSIVLTFLLTLSLAVSVAAIELERGWLSEDRLLQLISSSGYAYEMEEYAKEEIAAYLEEKSIPEEILSEVWDKEDIYRDFLSRTKEVLKKGKSSKGNSAPFQKELQAAILKDLESNQVIVTNAISMDIEQTVEEAGIIYERCLSPSFFGKFHQFTQTAEKWCLRVLILSIAVALVCIILLWRQYHYKHHAMQYMAAGVFTAILWNLFMIVFAGSRDWIAKAGVEPEAYRNLLEEFWDGGIRTGCLMTGIEILVFLILCMGIRAKRRKA